MRLFCAFLPGNAARKLRQNNFNLLAVSLFLDRSDVIKTVYRDGLIAVKETGKFFTVFCKPQRPTSRRPGTVLQRACYTDIITEHTTPHTNVAIP